MIEARQPIVQGITVPLLHRLRHYRALHYELVAAEITDASRGLPGPSDPPSSREDRDRRRIEPSGRAHEQGPRPRLGRGVARFNRRFTNRLTRPIARWAPGFGIVI